MTTTTDIDGLVAEARRRGGLPPPEARRYLRVLGGLTLKEVGDGCGVDRVTVSRWERGIRSPRGEARARYCELLRRLAGELTT